MTKIGTWTYWYKAPNGIDVTYCSNKKNIPRSHPFVQHFISHKSDGNIDHEIIQKGRIVWQKKNTNKLSECDKLNMGMEIQRTIHELLYVDYPEKDYKKVFEKRLKGCKITS